MTVKFVFHLFVSICLISNTFGELRVEKIDILDGLVVGEGPHWDDKNQVFYFVSISESTIHKYVLATGEHTKTKVGGKVSFIIPVENAIDEFVIAIGRKFLHIHWNGDEGGDVVVIKELAKVPSGPETGINDGKADAKGRLYAGTTSTVHKRKQGALYNLVGTNLTTLAVNISVANGMAWDLERKAFYYIDSVEPNIRRYDYDIETGSISNMSSAFDLRTNSIKGFPDGMTIDTDGNLFVAMYAAGNVIHINPNTKELLLRIPIPNTQVTSVVFGGPNLDILFVTTACIDQGTREPPCGSSFLVYGLGVKGYLSNNFRL